jgi:multisubunit Na+/H+ antiporter MnhC subunit
MDSENGLNVYLNSVAQIQRRIILTKIMSNPLHLSLFKRGRFAKQGERILGEERNSQGGRSG